MNAMRKLDASDRDLSVGEALEARHGSASSLDRPVILLDDVVEVLRASQSHVAPRPALPSQQSEGSMTGDMTIERHRAGWPIVVGRKRLTKERFGRSGASIRAQQKIHRLSLSVDGPIKVVPLALD